MCRLILAVVAASGLAIAAHAAAPTKAPAEVPTCHAALLTEGGDVLTDTKGEALLSTQPCGWYRAHHMRACKSGEEPNAGRGYVAA